jgi:hypothetical protein
MIKIHNRVSVFENKLRPKGSKRVSLLQRLTEHWVASKTYDEQKFEFYKNAQVANMKG